MTGTLQRTRRHVRPVQHARLGAAPGMRLDIQGLRAIAVVLVVVYHLWPWHLTGGYVGVDVFFVISGFLITSHMLREVDVTGTVNLPKFWARRARRLLPASLLVLAVSLAAVAAWVPRVQWSQFAREIVAAAAYVENLVLARDSIDYLGAGNAPSPVQHYWSLSAEEQFYVLWPLILVAALWIGRRVGARRRAIGAALVLVTAASFVSSVVWTASTPAQAYFVTPTRAWEFGAGAVLALLPAVTGVARVRAAAAWAGLALIGVAGVTFDHATPFPGAWALLPVTGTALVLWADSDRVAGSPTAVLRWRPVQAAGELSYSIYLWHWPLIVLGPYVLGRELLAPDKIVLVALVAALSYATWRLVETPGRTAPVLVSRRPRVTFAATLVAMAIVIVPAVWMQTAVSDETEDSLAQSEELLDRAAREAAQRDDAAPTEAGSPEPRVCIGAAVVDPEGGCTPTLPATEVVPLPTAARADVGPEECLTTKGTDEFRPCPFGVPAEEARGTIALVGDSHAHQWLPALDEIARAHGWHGISMTRESCPFAEADRNLEPNLTETCAEFNARVLEEIESRPDVSVVVMSALSGIRFDSPPGADDTAFGVDAYRAAIEAMPAHVERVYVIRDSPRPRQDVGECVAEAVDDAPAEAGATCAVPSSEGLQQDMLALAAEEAARAETVDLSHLYCRDGMCAPVVGNVLVYSDQNHLTRTWVRSAAPQLGRQMPAVEARS